MQILYRDEETAYRSDVLWLPKKHINPYAVKAQTSMYAESGELLKAYWETGRHLVVPREFDVPGNAPFPVVDYGPETFPYVDWECMAEDRDPVDVRIWDDLQDSGSGILHLGCGKGKTVFALRKIAKEKGPALIVVHTTQLAGQWLERITQFMRIGGIGVLPVDNIGIVRGQTQQWDKPIVIAMIQTLIKRRITSEIRRKFKTVVYDEAHHLVGPSWLYAARFGYGLRLGLTATPDNEVGTSRLYKMHLGPVIHSDVSQPQKPDCYFVSIPGGHDMKDPNILDSTNSLSLGRLFIVLGEKEERNRRILHEVEQALQRGRKILALSHSEAHCWRLHNTMPESGICVGDVPVETRLQYLAEKKIIFATMPLAKEGLDQPDLDTVMILTPFKKKNAAQQVVGRIQRIGGQQPLVVVFEDREIGPCASLCYQLRKHLIDWEFPVQYVRR